MHSDNLKRQIGYWTMFFIAGLMLSGITAFPLEAELAWLSRNSEMLPGYMTAWISRVFEGVSKTNAAFPFISYGTDWLAFAHIMIGLLFIGVIIDPVKNKWITGWGIWCCILVPPVAFIAGPVRDIPLFHRLIDCGFGLIGIIPLLIIRSKIVMLEKLK
jgi:hypothetical protein